ncbi:ATP-binding cassette sub-family G member 1-like [Diaphorina citri]|uniref:ATP-binding cassette sub-family G member 1-like n=1 Tax=Diaphorina citri TaxID=121845 RepID=A0A3Q0JG61_DIACI|nr:ATP-binding cassette sub-family G member 1-like [Diaphorina citri]
MAHSNKENNVVLMYNNDIVKDSSDAASGSAPAVILDLSDEKDKDNVTTTLLENALPSSQRRYATSELTQFFIVLKRTLLFSRRDWTLMYLRLFAHILVGFLIGALYYDIGNDGAKVLSNLGFLFFNMLFLMYTSMTITILSFPLEMPVLIKENFNRWYSLRSYYLAITLSDLPFQTIFCVVYVSIVYYLTSQPPSWDRFNMFLAACLLISFVAQSVGLVVGAAMNVQVYVEDAYCHFKDPTTTLEELDMTKSSFFLDMVALIAIFFLLRISAFVFLRWKLISSR